MVAVITECEHVCHVRVWRSEDKPQESVSHLSVGPGDQIGLSQQVFLQLKLHDI